MSTHTTYFCDHCNSDHESDRRYDGGASAITYSEYPVGDGWAEFEKPYTDRGGDRRTEELQVCAHCLADPEFDPASYGAIPEWDTGSRENFEKGRKHAEIYADALERLGTPDRWGRRGVTQVFDDATSYPYGYQPGPKLADGRFSTSDQIREEVAHAA